MIMYISFFAMATIAWNKVTWYSKLAAVILALLILLIGVYLGMQYQQYLDITKLVK